MILDARTLSDGQQLTAGICIVGAGAVGIAMALELNGSGLDVLVLESGGLEDEPATQALYAGSVADGSLHSPPDTYRQRRFGGSTTIWGGRCVPFDPIDFEARDYMPDSGWPIGIEALRPYYPAANRLCEAGRFAYTVDAAFDGARRTALRPMIAGFQSPHFTTDTIERFSCPTDFGRRYRHRLEADRSVRVVLHANVTEIVLNRGGTAVEALAVRTLPGKHGGGINLRVAAREFVIAAGGLESARLLLASRSVQPAGVGNRHDVVGRYYMCHLAGTIGTFQFSGAQFSGSRQAVWNGYDIADEGVYCRRRLALTAAAQRGERIGNLVGRLHHPFIPDPRHRSGVLSALYLASLLIPYEYRKRLHGDGRFDPRIWLGHVRNVVTDAPEAARFLIHLLRDRRLAARKFPSIVVRSRANRYSLDFHAEQEPNRDSRVTLGGDADALGMPRLRIDWRYSRGDVATVSRGLALLARDIAASGVGRFDYDPGRVEAEMVRYGAYGGHHIGTARMGTDPRSSVVDADCRVHGIGNLYVAGAAVFPTSGQANPTLTAVALALRLSDHLRRQVAATAAVQAEAPAPSNAQVTERA